MPTCEMCGKGQETLVKAKIEGTVLELCEGCAKFGEIIHTPEVRVKDFAPRKPIVVPKRRELLQVITDDYGQKIRTARERMGLKQEEFAKRLNEKESIMQKIEAGQFQPSIETARKLERLLKIQLVEEYSESEGGEVPMAAPKKSGDAGFTMADFIKDKRKK
jgi:putative transcription factor